MQTPPLARFPLTAELDRGQEAAPALSWGGVAPRRRVWRLRAASLPRLRAAVVLLALGGGASAQEAAVPPPSRPAPAETAAPREPLRQSVDVEFFGGEAEYRALLGAGDEITYVVTAAAGDRLHVDVISETGDVVFDVAKDAATLWASDQGTVFVRELPEAGRWSIRLHGADPETESAFRLYLGLDGAAETPAETLTAATEEPSAGGETADGAAPPASGADQAALEGTAESGAGAEVQLAQADGAATAPPLKVDVQPPTVPVLPVPDAPPFGAAAGAVSALAPAGAAEAGAAANDPPAAEGAGASVAADAPKADAEAAPKTDAEAKPSTPDAASTTAPVDAPSQDAAADAGKPAAPEAASGSAPAETAKPDGAAFAPATDAAPAAPEAGSASAPPETGVATAPPAAATEPDTASAPPVSDAGAPPSASGAATAPVAAPPARPDGAVVYYRAGNLNGAMLNLRRGPSRSEPVVAQAGEGRILVGRGCESGADMRWCRVEAHDDASIWGWAAEQFLTVTDAPAAD